MSNSDLIEIEMQMHSHTEKAILVSDDGNEDNAVWLPVSQIQTRRQGRRQDDRHHAGVAGRERKADLMPIVIRRKVVAPPPEPVVTAGQGRRQGECSTACAVR